MSRPFRMAAVITEHERECMYTEQREPHLCGGCLRALLDRFLRVCREHADEPELALGLLEQAFMHVDRALVGMHAVGQGRKAEREALGGMTADELAQIRVHGYSLRELAVAIELLRAHGLEDRIRRDDDRGQDGGTGGIRWRGRWRGRWR